MYRTKRVILEKKLIEQNINEKTEHKRIMDRSSQLVVTPKCQFCGAKQQNSKIYDRSFRSVKFVSQQKRSIKITTTNLLLII